MEKEAVSPKWSDVKKFKYMMLLILVFALAIRLYAIVDYGLGLNLHSDDAGYVQSAKWLLEYGTYSYYAPRVPTLHMMPGITYFLALFFAVFGSGTLGLYAAKIGMSIVGVVGIYGIYLIGKRLWHPYVGLAGAFLAAIYVPGIETDTLFLTETPFMTAFVFLLYFAVAAAQTHKGRDIYLAVLFYVISIYFRPTVALFPLVLLFYFMIKRYPWGLLLKQAGVGLIIVVALMCPWWIRNAVDFHQFVPLTDGTGNPILLGTYQGVGYPANRTIDQELERITALHPELQPPYLHEQAWMNEQKDVALERMKEWWRDNPNDFILSYVKLKPTLLWKDPFYWLPIFKIPKQAMENIQPYLVWSGIIGYLVALILGRKSKREALLMLLTILYYTVVYSINFVFGRYNEPLMPAVLLGIGAGIFSLIAVFIRRRLPEQSA